MASVGAVVASLRSQEMRKSSNANSEDMENRRPSIVIKPFPQYPPKWMNAGGDSNATKSDVSLMGMNCARQCFSCCFGCMCIFCGCWRCGNPTQNNPTSTTSTST